MPRLGDPRLLAALTGLVWLGAMVQVNAPSIGSGYGVVTYGLTLSALALPPLGALAAGFLGQALALPFIAASKSMFMIVAVLGTIVRPPVVAGASLVAQRRGRLAGALFYGGVSALLTTLIAILYYGDDGIHASLSVFDLIPALFALATVHAVEKRGLHHGAPSTVIGSLLFIAGINFYPSIAALGGLVLLLVGALAPREHEKARPYCWAAIALAIATVVAGWTPLQANLSVTLYPFKPESYTEDRWTVECVGERVDAMRGVYDPERLRIVEPCATVEGVVAEIPSVAGDGDYCFDLHVENASTPLTLSTGAIILRKGAIHAEIVPQDYHLLDNVGGVVCKGDRLRITGPLVVDTDHGQWSEIHPVMDIELLERGQGPCVSVTGTP